MNAPQSAPQAGHVYDDGFYDYINTGSSRSARRVLGELLGMTTAASVLDVGCGQGAWLAEWIARGVTDAIGVDGAYIDLTSLLISSDQFIQADLSKKLDLGRRFDVVQSLEVGEHIAEPSAETFVEGLTQHGDVIMFSAAVPGQGGEFHVNEQPLAYWRAKYAARGFAAFDAIRPLIVSDREVEPWYRYNTLIYANAAGQARLSPAALATRIPDDKPPADVAPVSWRMRNAFLGALPRPAVEFLARAKHRAVRAAR